MLEFCRSEKFRPLVRVISTKYSKISLDFLISSAGLSVHLRVICSEEVYVKGK